MSSIDDAARSMPRSPDGSRASRRTVLGLGAAGMAAVGTGAFRLRPAAAATGPFVPITQTQPIDPATRQPAPTTIFQIQPSDVSKAPFRVELGGRDFFGVYDAVLYFGYNVTDLGGKVIQSEPSFTFNIEQDYFQAGTQHTMEAYWEFVNATGSKRYRPFFMQFNRETGAMNACQFTSPSMLFRALPTTEYVEEPPYLLVAPGVIQMTPRAGLSAQVDMQASPGQHSLITLGDGGTPGASSIQTLGPTQLQIACGTARMYLFSAVGLSLNAYERSAALLVSQVVPSFPVIKARGATGGTGDMLQILDPASNVLSRFDKSGFLMTRKRVAPAEADLSTSELAMWYDPTPGATKVMFKGKDSSGAVCVGSVDLVPSSGSTGK